MKGNSVTKKKPMSGVYIIEFIGCNKFYIGSTFNLERREKEHIGLLKKGKHKNPHVQNAFNKYGEDSYKFKIVLICDSDKDYLLDIEQSLINQYDFDQDLLNFNRLTRSSINPIVDYSFVKNVIEDTANGVDRKKIMEKYNICMPTHRHIVIRKSYAWIPVDNKLVEKAKKKLRACDRYTKQELSFLKDNCHKDISFLSKKLGRSESAIKAKISRLNLNRGLIINATQVKDIANMFVSGKSLVEISKIYNCDSYTIRRIIRRNTHADIDLGQIGIRMVEIYKNTILRKLKNTQV
jgi:group I intron endonuclease